MSWMDKVKEGRVSEGGTYPLPGAYLTEVMKCKTGKTRAGVDFFVVELYIHESNNDARRVGTLMDYYIGMDKEPSLGNVKAFVMAAANCPEEEVNGDAIRLIVSDANPLKGTKLRLSATNIKTKAGRDFTKCKFFQPGDDPASAVEAEDAA